MSSRKTRSEDVFLWFCYKTSISQFNVTRKQVAIHMRLHTLSKTATGEHHQGGTEQPLGAGNRWHDGLCSLMSNDITRVK